MSKIGIIGGSGLYSIEGMKLKERIRLDTPFGRPSDEFISGELEGRPVIFLPRHARGHKISPTEINFRANIYGMKKLGVERIISVCAVGSLKEEIKPCDLLIPDQFVDRTNQARKSTFFEDGIVAHIAFAEPVCPITARILNQAATGLGLTVHPKGTYINMEGPAFSTRAESNLYKSWGMDIIGMTNMAEARLAREAELCYVTLSMVTDYDCWRQGSEEVSVDLILENANKNIENAKRVIKEAIRHMPAERNCLCVHALKGAIATAPQNISAEAKKKLSIIIGKYL
ncbi:MAG: S-methyl-5'-thioadenosine phosphorylase [Candidatus Omnitrophica bacterium]|nr:S-methyl-5'-thioadenosine phosphorylase [Candidatus Omnitrophota bacterium]